MLMKLLALLFVAVSIEAVAMISLSSSQFEETIAELSKKKPYLLKSPNDASVVDMEKNLHGKEAKNLVDLALSLNLTTLVSALEETGLDNIIDHEGKFTLFAPTNEAFENIPKWAETIPLKELLRFHVARGLIHSDQFSNEFLARSLLPKRDIRINIYKGGKVVTANGVPITSANYQAHNGVLHIIDRVVVSIYEREGNLVKELHRNPHYKTLSKLIALAELKDELYENGPFTLFAPSDDVFSNLPADVLKHLTDNPDILRMVLLNHVVPGTWFLDGLEDGQTFTTLQKSQLTVSIKDDTVYVGSATVTHEDKLASNGVIHYVNSVLIPPSVEKKLAKLTHKKRKMLKGKNGD